MLNTTIDLITADEVAVAVNTENVLGEGPLWDPRKQSLYWLDILESELHCLIPYKQAHSVIDLQEMAGSIHLTNDANIVVLTMVTGLYALNLGAQGKRLLGKPHQLKPGVRFNDGKTDANGRIWAGTMDMDCAADAGEFMRFDARNHVTTMLAPMTIPNGLAWTKDNSTLYHIDSPRLSVQAYAFELASGSLGSPTTVLQFEEDGSIPDGMCIDAEGMLWVAFFGGACVNRYDPHSGKQLCRIDLPAAQITSCCFGGADLGDLYITSSRYKLDEQALLATPLAGSLFKVPVDATGTTEPSVTI
jgi:sugar lactone lactonase YvrE